MVVLTCQQTPDSKVDHTHKATDTLALRRQHDHRSTQSTKCLSHRSHPLGPLCIHGWLHQLGLPGGQEVWGGHPDNGQRQSWCGQRVPGCRFTTWSDRVPCRHAHCHRSRRSNPLASSVAHLYVGGVRYGYRGHHVPCILSFSGWYRIGQEHRCGCRDQPFGAASGVASGALRSRYTSQWCLGWRGRPRPCSSRFSLHLSRRRGGNLCCRGGCFDFHQVKGPVPRGAQGMNMTKVKIGTASWADLFLSSPKKSI